MAFITRGRHYQGRRVPCSITIPVALGSRNPAVGDLLFQGRRAKVLRPRDMPCAVVAGASTFVVIGVQLRWSVREVYSLCGQSWPNAWFNIASSRWCRCRVEAP